MIKYQKKKTLLSSTSWSIYKEKILYKYTSKNFKPSNSNKHKYTFYIEMRFQKEIIKQWSWNIITK
jgi:hypothetical protein